MFDLKRRSLWADDDHNPAIHQYDFDGGLDNPEPSPRNMNLVGMYSNGMSSSNPTFSDTILLDNLERGNHPAFSSNSLKRNRLSSLVPTVNFFNPMRYFPRLETVYETGRESERFESRRISWMWSGKWSKLTTSPKNRPPSVPQNQNSPSPLSNNRPKDENVSLPSINENEKITSNKEEERIPSIRVKTQSIKATRPFSDTSGDTESSPSGTKLDERVIRKTPPTLSGWWKRISPSLPAALMPSLLHSPHDIDHSLQSFAESGQKSQERQNSNSLIAPEDHYSKKKNPSSCNRRYLVAIVVCFLVLGGVGTGVAAALTSFAAASNNDEVTLSPTANEYEDDLTSAPTAPTAPTTLAPTTLTPTASPTPTSFPTVFITPFPTNTPFPTRSPTVNDDEEDDD